MYIAMTMPPTTPPRTAIMSGSISVSRPGDRGVDFFLVEVGNLREHRVERAGRLADVDHLHDHRREHVGLAQRRRDRFRRARCSTRVFWIASSMMALPAVRAVMSRPSRIGTPEREQRRERAAEPRDRDLAQDHAEDRHLQQQRVDHVAGRSASRSTRLSA